MAADVGKQGGEIEDSLSRAKKAEAQKPGEKLAASAKKKLSRGDLFGAYDDATRAISEGESSEDVRQTQLLALARMGDTKRALELFRAYGLDRAADPHKRALGARLLKDRALESKSERALRAAYKAYRDIFAQTEDPYPGINAASMALLSGDGEEARWIATNILVHPTIDAPADYYCAATRAEAQLILGKPAEAADAIRLALALPGGDVAARAGTRRQLALLAETMAMPPDERDPLLSLLKPPAAFHYCGHMFVPDSEAELNILRDVDGALAQHGAGFAYGSAAAGADILVMEAMLARGGEVHIVLPCRQEDFVGRSVRPAGETWVPRFEYCVKKATEIVYATEMEWVSDPAVFGYSAAVAMGLAKLRAQHLGGDVFQLAVWDKSEGGPVGTGADVKLWRERGGDTVTIDPGPINRDYPRKSEPTTPPLPRRLASILFTDYAGFSKITESYRPAFRQEVMGRIAAVLRDRRDNILARNTWGDALYSVMDSAVVGGEIALGLKQSLSDVDPSALGLQPGQGGMRIAVHYGSVYETMDEVTERPNYVGTEVDRAARIEPVTPPGAVYVTEPMAAMLALEAPDRFHCQYVGRVELAKKYGTFPMYKLTGVGEVALYEDDSADSADEGDAMTSETSPRLFVSHHSSKLPVAEHVEKALNAKGVKCWIAPRDIEPGDQWPTAIRNAIEATDAVLLLFCSRSEKSRQVKRELILADQLGKAIIPLRLERIDPGELSYHLADSQWIDWLEQRDVVIDRIANKAHEFQRHGPMEVAPPVIEPPRGSVDDVPPIDPTRPPSPMPPAAPAPPAPPADAHVPTGFISLGKDQTALPPPPAAPPSLPTPAPMPAAGGFDAQRSSFADLPPAPPPGPPAPAGSWSPPAGSWPPPPGPDRGRAPPTSRKGLYIILGALGVALLVALIYLAVRSPGRGEEITEAWFTGSWADDRNCEREITRFDRNGTFTAANGTQGSWSIEDNVLTVDGSERYVINLRRIDDDEVRGSGDLSGTFYRCD